MFSRQRCYFPHQTVGLMQADFLEVGSTGADRDDETGSDVGRSTVVKGASSMAKMEGFFTVWRQCTG